VYDRSNHELLSSTPMDSDCGLFLKDDAHLISVTTHLSPATMSYYVFDDDANFVSSTEDPYNWDYEMSDSPMAVSGHYIITSTEAFIYTADEDMTMLTKITAGGDYHADFEFAADGITVYSAITNQRHLLQSTITGNTVQTSVISTAGFPWMVARDGDTLVVLSSPVSFSIYNTTNKVIVEKLNL
jgi:hypothetical protein